MRPFEISAGIQGGVTILRVAGDLDAASVPDLELALDGGAPPNPVVIDLSSCDFIDSAGIAVIVEAWRSRDGTGEEVNLSLAAASGQVGRLIRITGLDSSISVFPGVEEALAALSLTSIEPT